MTSPIGNGENNNDLVFLKGFLCNYDFFFLLGSQEIKFYKLVLNSILFFIK